MFQIENSAGKPATDGWLEVYIHGTREKYYCASNFDGTLHPFKIKLDSLGSNIVLADDGQAYDVYAYNRFGSLLMSRYNVQPGSGGSGSGGVVGSMQHWLGMRGPSYSNFPGDSIKHTLGIPKQSVDYVGDFIDRIETAPYPDGDVLAYIYLNPGLYHVECVIRYQQSNDDVKNTLDEVLVYTGHGNANEDVAYQLDASGPETNGNRHCLKQSFIRKVTDSDGEVLYFAPKTPTDWEEAYIQTLSIVKLDSVAINNEVGLTKVHHDGTMTGDGTVMNPLSIQDALDGKQDTLTPGEGINIDSDGVISAEGEKYYEGWGILIDSDNEISVDPNIIQKKITTGEGLTLDSDGNLNLDLPPIIPLVAGDNITIVDSDGSVVISAEGQQYSAGEGITIDSNGTISADLPEEEEVEFEELDLDDYQTKLTAGQGINIDSNGVISATGGGGGGSTYSAGQGIDITNDVISVDSDSVAMKSDLPSEEEVDFEELDLDDYQKKLTAGQGIEIDSDGTISATGGGTTYTAGNGINIANDVISVDSDSVAMKSDLPSEEEVQFEELDLDDYQTKLTAGEGVLIDSNGIISVDSDSLPAGPQGPEGPQGPQGPAGTVPPGLNLVAGTNINISASGNSLTISATGGGSTYTAGQGIDITNGVISVDSDSLPQGPDGESAYEIWLDQGNTGSEQDFLDSLQGEQGPQGIQGIQGVQGPQGIQGEQGPKGDTGATGPAGTVPPGLNIVAGSNVSITASNDTIVISATGGATYTAGQNINIDSDGTISATGVATTAQLQAVENEIPDVSGLATKTEVSTALAGKQGTLTGITDVQVVQSLPASPVSTVLYLIPEA